MLAKLCNAMSVKQGLQIQLAHRLGPYKDGRIKMKMEIMNHFVNKWQPWRKHFLKTRDQNHQLEWVSLIFAHCGIDTLRLFFRGRPHCKHASQITKLMVISELGSQTAGIAELGSAYMICAYQWLAQISLACHFEILQSRFNFSQVL